MRNAVAAHPGIATSAGALNGVCVARDLGHCAGGGGTHTSTRSRPRPVIRCIIPWRAHDLVARHEASSSQDAARFCRGGNSPVRG
jgi:hypothetical protein